MKIGDKVHVSISRKKTLGDLEAIGTVLDPEEDSGYTGPPYSADNQWHLVKILGGIYEGKNLIVNKDDLTVMYPDEEPQPL